ncbi:MAG: type II toxin-antitoxin system prevent-host-death family antitoxin [Raoultibacter sp.]
MLQIRPVSDLRNHYVEVERAVSEGGPVFLTKNGYGSMVVMNLEQYGYLSGNIESQLDAADRQAASTTFRYTHDEVFSSIRKALAE